MRFPPLELFIMIIIDVSEKSKSSRLRLEDAAESPLLESSTGADIMVSPAKFPALTEVAIHLHIEKGAVLVQRKSLRDLVESVYTRLKVATARMQSTGAAWWQCCVLASGVFLPYLDHDDDVLKVRVGTPSFDDRTNKVAWRWQHTNVQYKAFVAAKRRLRFRGVWLEIVSCDDEIPGWLQNLEQDLMTMEPIKEVYPPLQKVTEVHDARTVLASLKDIGPVRATTLWNAITEFNKLIKAKNEVPTLTQLLSWATAENVLFWAYRGLHPWSQRLCDTVRAQFPLVKGENIYLTKEEQE